MKISVYINYAIGLIATLLFSNISNSAINDSMMFNAMSDEMARSKNNLQYEDYEKPFFIAYSLNINTSSNIKASLGSLITSSNRTNYSNNVRLLIGDYQLNDEKFSDNVNKVINYDGSSPIPKDLNYWGIRRSFWLATNNIYKNASEKFKNKVGLMTQNNISKDVMTSPDFSKEQPVVKLLDELPEEISHNQLENLGKVISEVFLAESDIVESSVEIEYQNNVIYFLNSEGSKTKMPFRFYNIIVNASIIAEDNKTFKQKLNYNIKSIKELPSLVEMKSDAAQLVKNLKETANANDFEDTYNGSVLFLNKAVSQIILTKAFQKNNGLISKPNNLIYNKNKGLFYGNDSWDAMKNRKVIDKKITISSIPSKTEFNGKSLIGHSSSIDMEAVAVPDSLVLIDNGILLNQLNGRTPSTSQHNSNGHTRFYVSKTRVTQKIGADVILVSSSESQTMDELINRQNELAEEEGNEYVIRVKTLNTNADSNPVNYYKVDFATGNEELIRAPDISVNMNNFRSIEGVSDNMIMHNLLIIDQVGLDYRMKRYSYYPPEIIAQIKLDIGTQGTPASFIFPDGILMESLELKGSSGVIHTKRIAVPNPIQ